MALEDLTKVRLKKLKNIQQLGINPYPSKTNRKHTIEVARKMMSKKVTVAGRIRSLRPHGKITFADLEDATGKMQLFFATQELHGDKYEFLTNFDIGDFLQVSGEVFKTQAGEITVKVSDYSLLTKSIRPLPSDWYGLKDVEERYRKRYLDLLMNPEVKETFVKRTKIITAVREYLDKRDFLEVETPTLQEIYGGANARPFKTRHNALGYDFFLKISDELYLKRLMVGGFEKVYEIDKDFRNEGIDRSHNPEFTMLECYWAYADYQNIMELTEDLYQTVALEVLGTTKIAFGEHKIDLKAPWIKMTMKEAIKKYVGVDVDKLTDEEIKVLLKKHNLVAENKPTLTGVAAGFKRGIAIATLFELVEPNLIQPTFICDFPKETSALCKQKSDQPDLIERFEPYIAGFEIGNAYSELNDPTVQKEFFEEQTKAAKSGDKEAHPMDKAYLEAMEYGMPPMGGLGLGIDRMVMLLTDNPSIADVILFPTLKPAMINSLCI
ncbi:lysine--tRNA ligase [Candidatus Daviesbacteria bacterium RIFCSPLOWO2_02_FULL_38_15]|uniref:Lysine--tRNA ligase n=1 Tax=Candidatus Daviesbacteria bacterium RIFCSPLOWO2_02_FULL_38_15 TaxID=1797794 RepID=A0A1F5N4F1_9BACT|nr:MAG: lysine--tRNA ligase [Candidatus Daviesbacteria bacterium RIFCSPLOWO2_02_FULL_38_15]